MRSLTITVEEKVLQWAKVWAAQHSTSVSRLVGELLKKKMIEERGSRAAMRQYLSRPPAVLKKSGRYPKREELHERHRVR